MLSDHKLGARYSTGHSVEGDGTSLKSKLSQEGKVTVVTGESVWLQKSIYDPIMSPFTQVGLGESVWLWQKRQQTSEVILP